MRKKFFLKSTLQGGNSGYNRNRPGASGRKNCELIRRKKMSDSKESKPKKSTKKGKGTKESK